jgi:Wzt-like putative exopolysaccharide export protein
LIGQVGAARVAPMIRRMSFRDALAEYAPFDVITGHISAAPGDKLPPDRTCITLFRDPVDRALSEFFFSRTVHVSGVRDPAESLGDVEAWVDAAGESEMVALNAHVNALWPFGWREQSAPSLEKRLAAAKQGLDDFDLVGVQHRLHEFVAMLDFYAGWPAPDSLPRDNATPARLGVADIRPQSLTRLRDLLAPDIELFDYAKKHFAKQRLRVLLQSSQLRASTDEPDGSGAANPTVKVESAPETDFGNREMVIEGVSVAGDISGASFRDASGASFVQTGEWVTIRISFRSAIDEPNLCVGIAIRDHSGGLTFGTNTFHLGNRLSVGPGRYAIAFRFANTLGLGRYAVTAALHRGVSHLEGCFHWRERVCEFEVMDMLSAPFDGRVRLAVEAFAEPLDEFSRLTVMDDTKDQNNAAILGRRNSPLRSFAAALRAVDHLAAVPRGADGFVKLVIANRGSENWPAFGRHAVHVSYHWVACDGRSLVFDGLRTSLPHDLAPGQSVTLRCFFRAPDVPGRAKLVWTLVQEEVAWFDEAEHGSCLVQDVDVLVHEPGSSNTPESRLSAE